MEDFRDTYQEFGNWALDNGWRLIRQRISPYFKWAQMVTPTGSVVTVQLDKGDHIIDAWTNVINTSE